MPNVKYLQNSATSLPYSNTSWSSVLCDLTSRVVVNRNSVAFFFDLVYFTYNEKNVLIEIKNTLGKHLTQYQCTVLVNNPRSFLKSLVCCCTILNINCTIHLTDSSTSLSNLTPVPLFTLTLAVLIRIILSTKFWFFFLC